MSALEAGPYGWVQQISFVGLGLATMLHAVGLHRGIAPVQFGVTDPGGHLVGGMMFFLGTPVAFLLLARRLRADERWWVLTPYAVAAGLALVVAAVAMNVLVIPHDAPLHAWAGLAQRLVVLVLVFPFRVALGVRLLTVPSRTLGATTT